MKPFFYPFLSFITIYLLSILPIASPAEELEMVNRPINVSGLTGLLVTASPFALATGTVEIGIMTLSENSAAPDYTLTEFPASITIGAGRGMEFAVRGSYFYRKEGIAGAETTKRGAGDTEVSYKWNFKPQREYSAFPALALMITGIAPTADRDMGFNKVIHWGSRIGLAAGTEINWEEHVLGIYADAQMAVHDLSDTLYRDRYGIVNAGMLFPVSKHRNLQLLIEYTAVSGRRDVPVKPAPHTIDDMDYSAVTYGIRLVSERFNLTIGTQLLHKKEVGYDDSSRVVGMMSMKF